MNVESIPYLFHMEKENISEQHVLRTLCIFPEIEVSPCYSQYSL
jgi:hypothetical protein